MKLRYLASLLALAAATACNDQVAPKASKVSPGPPSAQAAGLAQQAVAPPSELVATPDGWYHKSCVYEVPNGAFVDTRTRMVTRPDGSTYEVGTCLYPGRRNAQGVRISMPTDTGWIESAKDVFSLYPGQWYGSMTAKWTIPANPELSYSSALNQAYFTFPGVMSPNGSHYILQPVLQWGWSGNSNGTGRFGGNFWTAASWRCNEGTDCFHSPNFKGINKGDVMLGTVNASNCANGYCRWEIVVEDLSMSNKISRKIIVSDTADYRIAVGGAVEVKNLTSCDQYPQTGVFFNSISFSDQNGQYVYPDFLPFYGDTASDPGCGFSVTSTQSAVNLYHNPPPMTVAITGPISGSPYSYVTEPTYVNNGTAPYTYSWTINGSSACGNSSSCTGELGAAGSYTQFAVHVTDHFGQQAGASAEVYACPPGLAPCQAPTTKNGGAP